MPNQGRDESGAVSRRCKHSADQLPQSARDPPNSILSLAIYMMSHG
jgi:hypothetical protein